MRKWEMLFNSLEFLLFFAIVTPLYFLLRGRARLFFLLCASSYFYMAYVPKYILILAFVIVVDYAMGILIEKSRGAARKRFLILSLLSNAGVLGVFKYWNFFNSNFADLFTALGMNWMIPNLNLLLPIGLSFHTFQSMSYTIEVYRERQKAERDPLVFALFVMFYPQLVAGPIERPQNLLHQFKEDHKFDYERVTRGLSLMLWGFFKKLVIADRLAVLVNNVFDIPEHATWCLWLGAYAFTIQIFCDFSGYSDIAVGAAQVMGFKLTRNFDRPYFARSISDFWNRWHISLSSWLRDYIFYPLVFAIRRFNLPAPIVIAAVLTMGISGLWHGASWTFIVWGFLHGFYMAWAMIFEPVTARFWNALGLTGESRIRKTWDVIVTFNLVTFALIFFRSSSTASALQFIWGMFTPRELSITDIGLSQYELSIAAAAVAVLFAVDYFEKKDRFSDLMAARPISLRWAAYSALFIGIVALGEFNLTRFIYFQF